MYNQFTNEQPQELQEQQVDISSKLQRLVALTDGYSGELALSSEDVSALAWIWQSLDDIEASIIGLTHGQMPQFLSVPRYQLSRLKGDLS